MPGADPFDPLADFQDPELDMSDEARAQRVAGALFEIEAWGAIDNDPAAAMSALTDGSAPWAKGLPPERRQALLRAARQDAGAGSRDDLLTLQERIAEPMPDDAMDLMGRLAPQAEALVGLLMGAALPQGVGPQSAPPIPDMLREADEARRHVSRQSYLRGVRALDWATSSLGGPDGAMEKARLVQGWADWWDENPQSTDEEARQALADLMRREALPDRVRESLGDPAYPVVKEGRLRVEETMRKTRDVFLTRHGGDPQKMRADPQFRREAVKLARLRKLKEIEDQVLGSTP